MKIDFSFAWQLLQERLSLKQQNDGSWLVNTDEDAVHTPGMTVGPYHAGTERLGIGVDGFQGLGIKTEFTPAEISNGAVPPKSKPINLQQAIKFGPGRHTINGVVFDVTDAAVKDIMNEALERIVPELKKKIGNFDPIPKNDEIIVTSLQSSSPASDVFGKLVADKLGVKYVKYGIIKDQVAAKFDIDLAAIESNIIAHEKEVDNNKQLSDEEKAVKKQNYRKTFDEFIDKYNSMKDKVMKGSFKIHSGKSSLRRFIRGLYKVDDSLVSIEGGPLAQKAPYLIIVDDNISSAITMKMAIDVAEEKGFITIAHVEIWKLPG